MPPQEEGHLIQCDIKLLMSQMLLKDFLSPLTHSQRKKERKKICVKKDITNFFDNFNLSCFNSFVASNSAVVDNPIREENFLRDFLGK